MAFARSAASGDRKDELDVARIDLLMTRNADRPRQRSPAQRPAELCAHAVAGVGEDRAKTNASADQPIEFGERDLRLRPRRTMIRGNAGALKPNAIVDPYLRQEQPKADHYRDLAPRKGQRHQCLAIGGLAQSRGVLRRDPHRMRTLLRQGRVVNDQEGVRAANQLVGLNRKFPLKRRRVPHPVRHKMVQPVVAARRDPLGHRPDTLALPRPDQPRHIERAHTPPRLVPKPPQKRSKPRRKLLAPTHHARAPQIRARSLPSAWLTNSYSVKVVLGAQRASSGHEMDA